MNGTGIVDFIEGTGRNVENSINKNVFLMGYSTRAE
jgi:hypothetical protein